MKIEKLYNLTCRFEKLAAYPTVETIGPVVKGIIDNLKSSNKDIMKGVFYASNFNVQAQIDYIAVSFLLNIDNDPRLQTAIAANKANRDNLIKTTVQQSLSSAFRGFEFQTKFTEYPTEKPGWFSRQPE